MPAFSVRVDDPMQASEHTFLVDAEDASAAEHLAAAASILMDRLGSGTVPKGESAFTYSVPAATRQAQVARGDHVASVARYAMAEPASAPPARTGTEG